MADTWQQIGQAGRAVAHRIDPSADTCPTCHQRVLTRHGVKLSRRQADMFDMVERATSRGGIDAGVLAELMNPGKPMRDARNLTRVTINQLNDRLEATNFRITGIGGRYRVVKREIAEIA